MCLCKAVGGGSPIDVAKAVWLRIHDEDPSVASTADERIFMPIIAIPTTLSAAESTQNAGRAEGNKKVSTSHPSPLLRMAELGALRELFYLLPAAKWDPSDFNVRQRLQLAAIVSLHPESRKGALGLSHGLGHALGATYAIPHGITSCITLAAAVIQLLETVFDGVNL